MIRKLTLLILALMLPFALLPLVPLNAQDTAEAVESLLADLTWLDFDRVESIEGPDGDPMLVIYYVTQESDLTAFRAEMLEVYRAIGADDSLALRQAVALSPLVEIGDEPEPVEVAYTEWRYIRALGRGRLSRTSFLTVLETLPLQHQQREEQAPA